MLADFVDPYGKQAYRRPAPAVLRGGLYDWRCVVCPWRILVLSVGGVLALFLPGVYYINYGHLLAQGSAPPVSAVLAATASYAFGGLVAFSEVLTVSPELIGAHDPLRVPMYTVNAILGALGIDPWFALGSIHAPFVDLGSGLTGNVYTALYAYCGRGGLLGLALWSVVAGVLSGWVCMRGFAAALVGPSLCILGSCTPLCCRCIRNSSSHPLSRWPRLLLCTASLSGRRCLRMRVVLVGAS